MPAHKHPTSPMTGPAARLVAICLEGAARWPVPKYCVYYSRLPTELLAAKRNTRGVNSLAALQESCSNLPTQSLGFSMGGGKSWTPGSAAADGTVGDALSPDDSGKAGNVFCF